MPKPRIVNEMKRVEFALETALRESVPAHRIANGCRG